VELRNGWNEPWTEVGRLRDVRARPIDRCGSSVRIDDPIRRPARLRALCEIGDRDASPAAALVH